MSLLFVKIALAPLIILIASFVGRRLGSRAAGFFIGLPTTALPFMLTMYLTHGAAGAVTTATGGLTGQVTCALFCIAYARTAPRLAALAAMPAALAIAAALGFTTLALESPALVGVLGILVVVAGLATWPRSTDQDRCAVDAWWAIPLRMLLVTMTVVTLATLEPVFGMVLAGALASLPMILMVMGPAEHLARGFSNAVDLVGGTLGSIAGTIGYLVVFTLAAPTIGMWPALALGLLAIPALNLAAPALAGRAQTLGRRELGRRTARAVLRDGIVTAQNTAL